MDSVDVHVLQTALGWLAAGRKVILATVARTWGSSPRPVGSMMAIDENGRVAGSVSGGCIEDDLIDKVRHGFDPGPRPVVLTYGVRADEAHRFGLPCGGTLRIVAERVCAASRLDEVMAAVGQSRVMTRTLDLHTGAVRIDHDPPASPAFSFDERLLITPFGPRWRIIAIGDGALTRYLCGMAGALGYDAVICDPRDEYRGDDTDGVQCVRDMPDDLIVRLRPSRNTAIITLTHDPKLDDMALLEALKSDAFYVGAIGSRKNQASRRERLRLFDLTDAQIARLHGPIGMHIGAHTPPEIAIAILAEMTAIRNGVPVLQCHAMREEPPYPIAA